VTDQPAPDSLLLTTNPDAISALFQADPLTLSDSDLDALVLELRRRRSEFLSAEAAAQAKPKATRAKAPALPSPEAAQLDKPLSELSTDDLLGD